MPQVTAHQPTPDEVCFGISSHMKIPKCRSGPARTVDRCTRKYTFTSLVIKKSIFNSYLNDLYINSMKGRGGPLPFHASGGSIDRYFSKSAMAAFSSSSSFSVACIRSRLKELISNPVISRQSPFSQTIGKA